MNGTELFAESTNDDSCARWLNMSLPWCEALAAKFNRMLLFSAEPRRCCNEQPFRIYALLVHVGRVHLTSNQKIKNNNNHHQYIPFCLCTLLIYFWTVWRMQHVMFAAAPTTPTTTVESRSPWLHPPNGWVESWELKIEIGKIAFLSLSRLVEFVCSEALNVHYLDIWHCVPIFVYNSSA